jgi:hypothetical protein
MSGFRTEGEDELESGAKAECTPPARPRSSFDAFDSAWRGVKKEDRNREQRQSSLSAVRHSKRAKLGSHTFANKENEGNLCQSSS